MLGDLAGIQVRSLFSDLVFFLDFSVTLVFFFEKHSVTLVGTERVWSWAYGSETGPNARPTLC